MCFKGKDADRVMKLLVNNLCRGCHWVVEHCLHILPFMSSDWVEVKVKLYFRAEKAAMSQTVVAHGCCSWRSSPALQQDRQARCVCCWGGRAVGCYWGSHHSQSPCCLPQCRIRWFHSLLTLGMSHLSQKGAVCEPREWPRLSMINTVAPQEVTRCYSSFIQLRYCCTSSAFLKYKEVFRSLSLIFIGNKKEASMWFNALSPSLFLPSGTAGLFSELLSLVLFLTEQISIHGGGRCSFC